MDRTDTMRELLGLFGNLLLVIELAEESRLTMRNLRADGLFEDCKVALARARALHGGANDFPPRPTPAAAQPGAALGLAYVPPERRDP